MNNFPLLWKQLKTSVNLGKEWKQSYVWGNQMSKDRWKRREKKKLNKRKHKVIGKSVFLLQKILGIKANKIIK